MNLYRHPILLISTLAALGSSHPLSANTLIELTQVPCQFVESETNTNHGFNSQSAEDCKQINAKSSKKRLSTAEPMVLEPGRYTFRVTNRNVPYPLGFWLRGDGLVGRATLPSVSGGGMTTGTTLDYTIDLTPGEYRYSCPLNPTPDYVLIVRE